LSQQDKTEPFFKRPFDIVLSTIGIIISSWLWALIWIAVLIEDGLPVFIKQHRIGRGGKLFPSFKFRSMKKSALNERVSIQAAADDPRVTRMGRILRKTALDELPQLLNIFLGDMSFVGPRALLPTEIELYTNGGCLHICDIPGYDRRCMVRPGLTGIAQIFAPRDIPRKHKFKYDLLYIRKMNLFLDIKLILLSFLITFKGRWERRSAKLEILNRKNT
jgi:lipopolysaccharide/colanic/teichoic acid biosynthesis glycosyltransferase